MEKLELTWIGKDNPIKVEPRILLHRSQYDYGDKETENMLIHGENLLALKALEKDFKGRINCIYIDPPYNIAVANPHYDDNMENSQWLNLMRPRIETLWNLLADDGLMAVQIDDEQFARLFLLMEEICTQRNMKIICVKMSEATGVKMASVNKARTIAKIKEFIILAKKDGIRNLNLEKIPKEKWDKEYKYLVKGITKDEINTLKEVMSNEDTSKETIEAVDKIASKIELSSIQELLEGKTESEKEEIKYENAWRIVRDVAMTGGAKQIADEKKKTIDKGMFIILTARGKKYLIKSNYNELAEQPRCKILFADQYLTYNPGDLWTDIKTTGLDNEGGVDFPKGKKPERLVQRIIKLNTKEGDIVLDSFLGSGTTCAVAHKLGRKWIGIEMGDQAYTHCKVRIDKVIDGTEQGGISKLVDWNGGGGYKFYQLAPTLINTDDYGEQIINSEYNIDMLASAVALHEGFTYDPSEELFWKQSYGNEKSFLFVTTRHIDNIYLDSIATTMQGEEYLVIVCKSFEKGLGNQNRNISIKKIPQILLNRCEFGKDDYSLNIIDQSIYEDEEVFKDEED